MVGEYGSLVRSLRSPMELYQLLHARFAAASLSMKALLLSVYLKLMVMDPGNQELRSQVTAVFERYRKVMDAELQQRAVEYLVWWSIVFLDSKFASLWFFIWLPLCLVIPDWCHESSHRRNSGYHKRANLSLMNRIWTVCPVRECRGLQRGISVA